MTYSISHTDLDGYSAQLIIYKLSRLNGEEIKMFNVNYGKPITAAIEDVFKTIKSTDKLYITDLNIDEAQAATLEQGRLEIGFELVLLDHHETGKNVAAKYDWYTYVSDKCATRIVHEYFGEPEFSKSIAYFVDIYDLYRIEHKDINKAKCLNNILMERRKVFPEVLEKYQRLFNFKLIEDTADMLAMGFNIMIVEGSTYMLERDFFDYNEKFKHEPINTVKVRFMYEAIIESEMYTKVEIDGQKGEIYVGLSSIFQEFSAMRNAEGELDFVCNINPQGYIGFRSGKGKANVAEIAKKYFNGGGHENASGGSLPGVQEGRRYKEEELVPSFLETI